MEKLKVFTAFSGYDSQCMALDKLGIDYELVGWSEIDKYAIQAHNAIYPQWADRNYGDISKINWDEVPDFDLFTYSSPCQDFSNAGLQRGGLKDMSRCLKANNADAGVVHNYRIRKLTPRECFRLMDVSEENIDKIQAAGISNTQQYKLAGNSIVVDVLYYIFKNLLCTTSDHTNQTL